jgi:hypothetical protein
MDADDPRGLLRWFDELDDPRRADNVMHLRPDMLTIASLAAGYGAERAEAGPDARRA